MPLGPEKSRSAARGVPTVSTDCWPVSARLGTLLAQRGFWYLQQPRSGRPRGRRPRRLRYTCHATVRPIRCRRVDSRPIDRTGHQGALTRGARSAPRRDGCASQDVRADGLTVRENRFPLISRYAQSTFTCDDGASTPQRLCGCRVCVVRTPSPDQMLPTNACS